MKYTTPMTSQTSGSTMSYRDQSSDKSRSNSTWTYPQPYFGLTQAQQKFRVILESMMRSEARTHVEEAPFKFEASKQTIKLWTNIRLEQLSPELHCPSSCKADLRPHRKQSSSSQTAADRQWYTRNFHRSLTRHALSHSTALFSSTMTGLRSRSIPPLKIYASYGSKKSGDDNLRGHT